MEMTIATDLHGHSGYSDGRASPEEFVLFRKERGFRLVALTDHDVLSGVFRAAAKAASLSLRLLPAMEVTSFVDLGKSTQEQIHILAYFPPRLLANDGAGLRKTFLYQRGLRVAGRWRDFVLSWLEGLPPEDRSRIIVEPFLERPATEFPGLLLFLDHLRSVCHDQYMPFVRHHVSFWTQNQDLFGWSPEELIDTIRADGAVDIVAHPARYRDKDRLLRLLLGATGVEVYTSRHRPEWAARFRTFAEENSKHWTASSDDHQNATYAHPPSGTPRSTVELLLDEPWTDATS